MTSTLAPQRSGLGLSNTFAVGSALATLGSFGYISLNGYDDARDAFLSPVNVVSGAVATIGIVMMALAVKRWRTSLPDWAVGTVAAGLVFTAAGAWFFSTGILAVAEHTSHDVFMDIGLSPWVIVMTAPKMVLCFVGFLAFAVSGWRSGALPRSACAAFAVAAVASIWPPHPPAVIVASLAFFLISRTEPEQRV